MRIRDVVAALLKLDQDKEVEVINADGEDVQKLTLGCQINID